MVNRNVYLSISIIGLVFAFLTLITEQSLEITLTILYLTLTTNLLIKLAEEWQYYRSYNAAPASGIFILIPTLIALSGSFLAQIVALGEDEALQVSEIETEVTFRFVEAETFFLNLNLFGILFALPFFIILLFLLRKYYSGRYPAIFIFRKKYPHETLVLYNVCMIGILLFFWAETNIIELSGLFFVIGSSILFIQHFILKIVIVPLRRIPVTRSNQQSSPNQRGIRSGGSSRTARPTSTSVRRQSSPNRSRPTNMTWSNSPSSQTRSSVPTSRSRSISRNSSISVVPGLGSGTKVITHIDRLSPAILSSITPSGQHLTKDDFRCIFCYEFPIENDKKVAICPHCGYPAHEAELRKWLAVAEICSRCNKPISRMRIVRVNGNTYSKLIKMFQKNRLPTRKR